MEKEKTQISLTLAENESVIRTWCENCDDIQIRPMKLGKTGGTGALLIYVEVAVSCVMLKDSVIGKLLNRLMEVPEADIPGVLSENQLGISDALEFDTMEAAFASMLAGNAILFVDHYDRAVKIGSKGYPNLGVQKAESEKVLRGSNEGFSARRMLFQRLRQECQRLPKPVCLHCSLHRQKLTGIRATLETCNHIVFRS